ncbi:glycosyltransferase [Streptomyces virginiae]
MKVAILDHPSRYPFPPHGYGAQEKWFWSVAAGARAAGAEVVLTGPDWRPDLPYGFRRLPFRLEDATPGQLRAFAAERFDLLVTGHEYTSHPVWRPRADDLGVDVAAFQHRPDFTHAPGAYDDRLRRLYVFSHEMRALYAGSKPRLTNAVFFADSEEETSHTEHGDGTLAWCSRLDGKKAPHIVAMAAARLRRTVKLIGPVADPGYMRRHARHFDSPHVRLVGELGGQEKLAELRASDCMVYSCSRDWIEAGGAFFSDPQRNGVPCAAQVWRPGTSAEAALDEETGALAVLDPGQSDEDAADALADAVLKASALDRAGVREAGLRRFDPVRHFQDLATR